MSAIWVGFDVSKRALVFLDYRMPSNGGRVLSILKGDPDLRVIPVVVLTGRDLRPGDLRNLWPTRELLHKQTN